MFLNLSIWNSEKGGKTPKTEGLTEGLNKPTIHEKQIIVYHNAKNWIRLQTDQNNAMKAVTDAINNQPVMRNVTTKELLKSCKDGMAEVALANNQIIGFVRLKKFVIGNEEVLVIASLVNFGKNIKNIKGVGTTLLHKVIILAKRLSEQSDYPQKVIVILDNCKLQQIVMNSGFVDVSETEPYQNYLKNSIQEAIEKRCTEANNKKIYVLGI